MTGKALEAYTRLSEEDAMNYKELKNALLKRYNLTPLTSGWDILLLLLLLLLKEVGNARLGESD